MSNALVQAALNRRHGGAEREQTTLEYGGDERRPVEPLSDEDDIRAKQLLSEYGAIVEQLQREDPDQLQPHHAIIVNLLAKDPTEAFTPSELAGLYVAFHKIQAEYEDDNSAVSKIRGYGRLPVTQRANDPREKERKQNIDDLEGMREEIFWHLTGFQETRTNLQMPDDPQIDRSLWRRVFFNGRIRQEEADHASAVKKVEDARDDFYRDNQDMFTMSRFMDKQADKALASTLQGELSGLAQADIDNIVNQPNRTTAEAVIAQKVRAIEGLTGQAARDRAKEIYEKAMRRETSLALETHFMKEMDSLVEDVLAESMPTDPRSLASEISALEKKIEEDTRKIKPSTAQAEKDLLNGHIKENKRKLQAAKNLQRLAKPGQEKQFKDPAKRTAQQVARLAGINPTNATEFDPLKAELGEMFELPSGFTDADLGTALAKTDSVSFMQMLFELLFKAMN